MKNTAKILAFAAISLFMVSASYAQEPEIVLNNVYTTMDNGTPATEFMCWQPVLCHMEFEVFGDANKYYKVIGITTTLGDKIVIKDSLPPGVYYMTTIHFVEDYHPLGPYTVNYKMKLKKAGALLDLDKAESEITVVE